MSRSFATVRRLALSIGALLAVAVLASGCGGGGGNASLSGKVTYKGQPLHIGRVTLVWSTGKNDKNGRPIIESAFSPISKEGTYHMEKLQGGAKAQVAIESVAPAVTNPLDTSQVVSEEEKKRRYEKAGFVPIPEKYAKVQTSGLSIELKGGANQKDFDLTD
jgi:hypothetical protein